MFLFVFIPILRSEISTFVETWNGHRIRPQKARPNHIAGIPNELYTNRSLPRYGWTPDPELLAQLEEAVKDVGKRAYVRGDASTNLLQTPTLTYRRKRYIGVSKRY